MFGHRRSTQPLATPGLEAQRTYVFAFCQPDGCGDRFATHWIWYAEDAGLDDCRMAFEQGIYLRGLHLEAAAIYFVLDAASNPNAALFIDQSLVAGPEIALMKAAAVKSGRLK